MLNFFCKELQKCYHVVVLFAFVVYCFIGLILFTVPHQCYFALTVLCQDLLCGLGRIFLYFCIPHIFLVSRVNSLNHNHYLQI